MVLVFCSPADFHILIQESQPLEADHLHFHLTDKK